jgi:glycosyltransferase involved in cell wall biosynthesis
MRLLWFNLATDCNDPVLGFGCNWISAVAKHVDWIDVLTMRSGPAHLPKNVRVFSVGKEKGYSEARRAVVFYWMLGQLLSHHRYDACFSHMMPLFTAMAGPVLKLAGVPIVTWYAHASVTHVLRVSHFFSTRVVASVASAYPYRHDKLVVIGQGIDAELFSPGEILPEHPPLILCVGRISPVKDHPTLLKAAALLRARAAYSFRVIILGHVSDPAYFEALKAMVADLGLESVVEFEAGMPLNLLPDWYRRCTVHVNLTPAGSADKVAWEAMACARPSIVANEGFVETLGNLSRELLYPHGDAAALACRLERILGLESEAPGSMGAYLRTQVLRMHGLESLGCKIVDVALGRPASVNA